MMSSQDHTYTGILLCVSVSICQSLVCACVCVPVYMCVCVCVCVCVITQWCPLLLLLFMYSEINNCIG